LYIFLNSILLTCRFFIVLPILYHKEAFPEPFQKSKAILRKKANQLRFSLKQIIRKGDVRVLDKKIRYTSPEMEITLFKNADIVTASGETGWLDPNGNYDSGGWT